MFNWAKFENHWDLFFRNCVKAREKETQIHHAHKFLWKRILSNKQNIGYVIISVNVLGVKLQGIVWDLSMLRKS